MKVSETLTDLLENLRARRDNEVSAAQECGVQYITDHNDRAAFAAVERETNRLARAWDRMIARLEKWTLEADKIEASCENFYGD